MNQTLHHSITVHTSHIQFDVKQSPARLLHACCSWVVAASTCEAVALEGGLGCYCVRNRAAARLGPADRRR
jgi:hypothetical protein